jgi:hypothetical protein
MPRVSSVGTQCTVLWFSFAYWKKSNPFALSLSKDASPFYKGGLHRGVQRGIYPSARGLGVEKSCQTLFVICP